MSDDDIGSDELSEQPDVTDGVADEPTEEAGAAKPPARAAGQRSAAAQAASRARRIGGRPVPGPRTVGDDATTADTADAEPAKAATVEEPKRRPRPTPTPRSEDKKAPKAQKPQKSPNAMPGQARNRGDVLTRFGWIPTYIAAVLLAAMIGITVWQSHGVWWGKSGSTGQQAAGSINTSSQVLAAAKDCFAKVTAYDYRDMKTSEDAGASCTTGDFTNQYKAAMEQTITPLAAQSQTVQTTQVAKAGIQSVSSDGKQWVILVYGQQTVTNKETMATKDKSPRLDVLSAQVTMNKVGNKWLMSQFRVVS